MPEHPSVENLKDDLAMAAVQNPHPDGSPEAMAYHEHVASMADPQQLHLHVGKSVEDIIGSANMAASQAKTAAVVEQSHDQRAYDQQPGARYTGGAMDRYGKK